MRLGIVNSVTEVPLEVFGCHNYRYTYIAQSFCGSQVAQW